MLLWIDMWVVHGRHLGVSHHAFYFNCIFLSNLFPFRVLTQSVGDTMAGQDSVQIEI